jgi:murein DD-endopeptidase MepM/ murein hydrolase activator NlpD
LINPNPNSHWVRGYTWYHSGVDISTGQYGTPVIAAQSGQVIFSSWDPNGGGYSVKVNHCWGLATSYSHMEKILVSLGQYVNIGQVVGLQGSTGNSTGPHVHFMTWWNNNPFDPLCAYGSIDGVSSSSHYGGCP